MTTDNGSITTVPGLETAVLAGGCLARFSMTSAEGSASKLRGST